MNAGLVLGLAGLGVLVARRSAGAAPGVTETVVNVAGWPVTYSRAIRSFADAVAFAEGFYASASTIPRRLNNPGDLKISSVPSMGADAQGHLRFATLEMGWEALHRQLYLIVSGRSNVYNGLAADLGLESALDLTIAQMATKYAEGSANWARNVADRLGVPVSTALRVVLT